MRALARHAAANGVLVEFLIVEKIGRGRKRHTPVGQCVRVKGGFRVYIEAGHETQTVFNTLVHEVAHALTWDRPDHGNAWALAFGRCYRATVRV